MALIIGLIVFVFIIGLCIGSFLNVVILRSLSEESIVFPASKCPKCQTPLKWWHNIPVISYIFLRGKCAFCKEPISIQYPIIELFTAIVFTLCFFKFGLSFDTLFAWIISALLIVIAMTDIKEKVVFDIHTYSLIGVGITYALIILAVALYQNITGGTFVVNKELFLLNPLSISLFGALLGAAVMEIAARLGYFVAGTRAFGEGDTLIAAGLGAVFGWKTLLLILAVSIFIQVIFTLPVFVKKLIDKKDIKTVITLAIFSIYAITFFIISKTQLLLNDWVYLTLAAILAIIGLYLCKLIISGIKKESKDELTYLPFGPAMVAAAFLFLLF
ncbi:MAG: prepilin peptidase [Clostridiaceae bacterium]|jgi:leader peptidase (prepilin peptidase) / N-methyltransferase|nr:prepilin peptidase [Clostridiaceae bacterium]